MRRFIVIETYGSQTIQAEDIKDAIEKSYNNHYGFSHILGVIVVPEECEI